MIKIIKFIFAFSLLMHSIYSQAQTIASISDAIEIEGTLLLPTITLSTTATAVRTYDFALVFNTV